MLPFPLSRLAPIVISLCACACVSSSRYDAAVQSAEQLRGELNKTQSARARDQQSLQARLDAAAAEDARLRDELAKLGSNAGELRAEKGSLSTALSESQKRLEELRRAQAAADARARQYRELASRLQKMVDAGDLRVVLREGRMVLQLPNDILFESGRVDVKPKGKEALKQLAAVLVTLQQRKFQVAGHTDNVPIAMSGFPSNWELSTARGVEVVRFLVESGLSPKVLSAAGYGEFDPIAPNTDATGRAQNRRIEITLQPNVDELVRVSDLH